MIFGLDPVDADEDVESVYDADTGDAVLYRRWCAVLRWGRLLKSDPTMLTVAAQFEMLVDGRFWCKPQKASHEFGLETR